jgi:TetR/AcrR family transcriptional regulator, acrAB operon repressor
MMERIEVPFFERFECRLVSEQADPMSLLRTLFDDLFSAIETDTRTRAAMEIMMLRCEMVDEQAFLLERQQRQLETFVAGVALALSKAQEQGRIRSEVGSRDLARALHAMASGLIRMWLMRPQAETLTATGQRMVETLLAGFECRS